MASITLPYGWKPREYQLPLLQALEGGTTRAVVVWHRRGGKDLTCLNYTIQQTVERVGLYWHILPTYAQGRKIVWEGMTRDGRKFLDHFPRDLIERERKDEMAYWLKNGSVWQVIGTEDVNRLVGTNPVGCVFSEYSLQDPKAWNFIRPILAENGGWALFPYTPRGRNHGYRLYKMALENPNWFCQLLTVDDTSAIPMSAIDEERAAGMPEELIQQEFWCSFDAPLVGSYYGDILAAIAQAGQIGRAPYDPAIPVTTAWDLGIGDATGIWFAQQNGAEVRLIDYYEHSGVGVDHYARVLQDRKYVYKEHLVPHDATVREWGSEGAKTRVESARALGLKLRVVAKLPLDDGINAVRLFLPRCYIDETRCERGLAALREYTKEIEEGQQDHDGRPVYRDTPKHDWTSHAADAIRTLAVGLRNPRPLGQRKILAPRVAIV